MLAIKNNLMAGNAARHLGKAYDGLATSVERLASGLRINSAKDDAAGLAVRELIRADIAVLQQGARNASDGISMMQTMEGAMAVIDDSLIRMNELAEQAATGSYSAAQRIIMNNEFAEMAAEIERIADATKFNNIAMLNTDTGSISIHVGTTSTIDIENVDMTQAGLGVTTGSSGFTTTSGWGTALPTTDGFLTVTGNAATDTVTMTIQFLDGGVAEDAITISLKTTTAANADHTLQEIIDLINAQSQNLGNDEDGVSKNHAMASAVLNTSTSTYRLKLSSRLSGADTVTASTTATSAGNDALAGFIGDADGTVADLFADGTGNGGAGVALDAAVAGTGINILDETAAALALIAVTAAITTKDEARATFGYKMNRLESTISILDIQAENLMAAESRVSDVDVATEMATLTRTQVLSQAGIAMLAQANSMPQMALTLLR